MEYAAIGSISCVPVPVPVTTSGANGGCLNLWGVTGPSVGLYQCVDATNNDWTYDSNAQHLVSSQDGSCLSSVSGGAGNSQFMVRGC